MTGSAESKARDARAAELLQRIADQLDVPVGSFPARSDERMTIAAQAGELVSAFCTITDPSARARCLTFVRALADRVGYEAGRS